MPLYQCAAVQKEKIKDNEVIEEEKLIVGIKTYLTHDPQGAMIQLVLDHQSEIKVADQKRLNIIVRPFT